MRNTTPAATFLLGVLVACLQHSTAASARSLSDKGYYHSSGYYFHSSSSSSDSGDNPSSDDAISAPAIALFTVGSFLVVIFCAVLGCCLLSDRFRINRFYRGVRKARAEILEDAKENAKRQTDPIVVFSEGKFKVTYLPKDYDRQEVEETIDNEQHESTGTMVFHHPMDSTSRSASEPSETATSTKFAGSDDAKSTSQQSTSPSSEANKAGDGKAVGVHANSGQQSASSTSAITITGVGKDHDGPFTIRTGKVSPYTGKCYWLEETVRDDSRKTRVLVTGVLARDEESGVLKFTGEWQSSFGARGSYAQFDIFPNSQTPKDSE